MRIVFVYIDHDAKSKILVTIIDEPCRGLGYVSRVLPVDLDIIVHQRTGCGQGFVKGIVVDVAFGVIRQKVGLNSCFQRCSSEILRTGQLDRSQNYG